MYRLQKLLLSCLFLLFFIQMINAQSKLEYGIGIGINHSKITEEINSPTGPIRSQVKGLRLPALILKMSYKQSEKIHFNSGLALSWLGSITRDLTTRDIATTLEIPALAEWNLSNYVQISSGAIYNYILDLKSEDAFQEFDYLHLANTRHHLGLKFGVAFSYEIVELSFNYAHYFTNVLNLQFTDENGNYIGTLISRFQNFRIGITIRV